MLMRYNKALKLFAILLFLVEFLSPAMMANAKAPTGDSIHSQIVSGDHAKNFLYSVFREDSVESEKNKEDAKGSIVLFDFLSASILVCHAKNSDSLHQHFLTTHRYTAEPPLFKLNCTFIV